MISPSTSSHSAGGPGDKDSAVALTAGGKPIELGKYRIMRLLGQGGFGVTYLAKNIETGQDVVIKENLPTDFAHRDMPSMTIVPLNDDAKANFKWALDSFLREARLLRQLNHPDIVKVQDAFSALGTAYYVMPCVGGKELGQAAPHHTQITETWLTPILCRLLEALQYLHSKNLLHRDIKTSNILMREDGTPVLIDFGAARAIISEKSATKVGCPGYTPIEQMQSKGKCGPWTDIYALGATCYRLITGQRPPTCEDRMGDDEYRPLAQSAELYGRFSRKFLAAIDKALAIWGKNRWQKAEEWLAELDASAPLPPLPEPEPEPTIPAPRTAGRPLYIKTIMVVLLLLLLGTGWYGYHAISTLQDQMDAEAAEQAQALAKAEPARKMAEEKAAIAEAEANAARSAADEAERKVAEAEEAANNREQDARQQAVDALEARGISASEYNEKLREAADKGDFELVQLLITAGADVNAADSNNWTPLLNAAYYGHTEVAIALIDAGADIEKDSKSWTPLFMAAQKGHTETAQVLIEKGANIEAKLPSGATPLYIAAQNGHTETVLALIGNGASIEAGNNNNATPLYIAAQNGHTETVLALIEKDANIEAGNNNNATPLYIAAQNGHTETVLALIEKDANIEAKDNSNATPLYVAAQEGQTETVLLLIEKGANIEAGNLNNATPLFIAAQCGHNETIRVLLKKGANIEAAINSGGTPLLVAVENGHSETISLLLDEGANIEAKLADKSTPLIMAAYFGKTEAVRVLLERGANRNAKDNQGKTALDWAREKGHTEIVELLR